MAATLAILALEYVRERRVSPVPLVTAIMVIVFGGLTLYLKDPRFIKMKPTVLYAVFGLILLGGLPFGRLPIKYVLSHAFELDEQGWRKITFRYGLFFLVLAVLNEIVWRNFSQAVWLDFKVFGIVGLMFLFSLGQMPLINAHGLSRDAE
jgi:intracellular septation protein